ncbi:MAG: GntR family transcriptional regulator [Lactobacillus sp.]|jgi:GntR family transcriptional regulator of bglA|uniref:GntR family transcriptional regulator n=1 Tax=Lacticaseibacillus suilingensis TaxID=2799577 RepID=A0ABW4BFS9_9LACO|nr:MULTISPECIES: GntR family transcriptional regulator [Lacticaseibacillus]MCI1894272.1 GntR family transcriptional regulator [Lactobacillus sp.]MCI1916883.1 GntR family transcriptional regulator [Lactobacillus sp.]MCI1942087.1 GntR family transcriptional regulator [Lactobacillus sp.]MCI1972450.1 GntR family transcriptional regulator [Lactobacillus sp.]MCI2017035.1 GntR family transcriptional regulator [Lactobacillus sp.]
MYHQIAEELLQSIQAGEYQSKLPTEQELMKRFNVSRNTIRRAIDVVYQHGLLRRIQGSGYYVNNVQLQSTMTINLSIGAGKSLAKRGPLKSKIVTFDRVLAREIPLAQKMKINDDTELWRIIRLRYFNGMLYCLEEAYYLRDVVPFISTDVLDDSLFDFVKETYDIDPDSSDDFLSMTTLGPDKADLMNLKPGTSLLTLAQINYMRNNVIFNFSQTVYCYPGLDFYFHSAHLSSN